MTRLAFHFDYISPYAYLAWQWVREVCAGNGVELVLEPTILGVLLSHHGHLGPAEIPAKREFVFRDILRAADAMGVPIEFPQAHPFNPVLALRASMAEVAEDQQVAVVDALWKATWAEGRDVSTPQGVTAALDAAGLDGAAIVERAQTDIARAQLREKMGRAVERGLFGVPTFLIDDELFWGNDQRPWIEAYLKGERGYDAEVLQRFLDIPFGVRRQR